MLPTAIHPLTKISSTVIISDIKHPLCETWVLAVSCPMLPDLHMCQQLCTLHAPRDLVICTCCSDCLNVSEGYPNVIGRPFELLLPNSDLCSGSRIIAEVCSKCAPACPILLYVPIGVLHAVRKPSLRCPVVAHLLEDVVELEGSISYLSRKNDVEWDAEWCDRCFRSE